MGENGFMLFLPRFCAAFDHVHANAGYAVLTIFANGQEILVVPF